MADDTQWLEFRNAYAAVQGDESWRRVLDALNTQKLAWEWTQQFDGGTPRWQGQIVDPHANATSLQELRRLRRDLALRYDRRVVQSAFIEAAGRILDGPHHDPAGDVDRILEHREINRPSRSVVQAIQLDTLVDGYRSMSMTELAAEQELLQTKCAIAVEEGHTGAARTHETSLRAVVVATEQHGLIDQFRNGLTDNGPQFDQAGLPSWIPERYKRSGLDVTTPLGPVHVQLASSRSIEAAAVFVEQQSKAARAHLATGKIKSAHPVFAGIERFVVKAGVVPRLGARLASRSKSFNVWRSERDALVTAAHEARVDESTGARRVRVERSLQAAARRQIAIELGLVQADDTVVVGTRLLDAEFRRPLDRGDAAKLCDRTVGLNVVEPCRPVRGFQLSLS